MSPEDSQVSKKASSPLVQVPFGCRRVVLVLLETTYLHPGLPCWWPAIRPTNWLASQHLWPFPLLFESLTFPSVLSRQGSTLGARPGSCSFWLTPFWHCALYREAALMATALHLLTKFSEQ